MSTRNSDPSETQDAQSATPASFSERRKAFFARREGLFLWLLCIPFLLLGFYMLLHYMGFVSNQGGILETIARQLQSA